MRIAPDQKPELPPQRKTFYTTKREPYDKRLEELREERAEYLEECKDISDHIQLRRGRYLASGTRASRKRSSKILNEKGTFASRICGAGMLAGVSSPSLPWLKLKTPDKDLNESVAVKRWLDTCERYLYDVFASSNYYHVKQSAYRDMADFGQGPVIMDEDFDTAINNYCSPPGEYMLGVNHVGIVDTMYREMTRTTLQLLTEFWHLGTIPREVRDAYDHGDYEKRWSVVSVIEPNFRRIRGMRGAMGAPFVQVYYTPDAADTGDNNAILGVSPIYENPLSVPRWEVQPGDVYGDGPGALVLPTVKSLQVLERRKGQMVDKMASPPTQAPAEMKVAKNRISHMPGDVSFYPSNTLGGAGGRPITPLYEVQGPQMQAVLMEMQVLENRIDTGYFVDLFMATLNSDRRQVTATEIAERHEEKLIMLGPVLERTHFEGLNVDVRRAFGVLSRHRVLPPPPPEADGLPLEVEYTSLLAVAQRAVAAGPIERFAGFLGNLAAGNPDVIDKWDMDQTVDEYADAVGVPASMVRSDDEVAKLREARQQQMANAQAMETAKVGADTAKVLSQADTGRDSNLLADLLGGGGQGGALL